MVLCGRQTRAELLWKGPAARPVTATRRVPHPYARESAISKELKKRGWKFVGPTTCYAMMQACGMVIDHPHGTVEWNRALQRLKQRPGGFQDRKPGMA
mmetsp:Transcript_11163/g.24900  ORF Transcript_11163/g.24900 Transcript_11163/m.24900 type:complete len:98 (-) Transcript_11163:132-425(-)